MSSFLCSNKSDTGNYLWNWILFGFTVTLHFEMVVSAGKVADLQRVGMLSSLGEFSIS